MANDILGLAYLVFRTRKRDEYRKLFLDVLGATLGDQQAGADHYRIDDHAVRFVVENGDEEDLVAIGFEARDKAAMWDVAMRARDDGAFVEEGLDADAKARRVRALVRFEDPAGLSIEVVDAPEHSTVPVDHSRCEHGFVTGELGLGHVAVRADDVAESRRFYERVLGFRLSDRIRCQLTTGHDVDLTFLRVNPRHHTIALGKGLPKQVHHFMVQVASVDDLGAIHDRCWDHGVKVANTLGRHPNDRMLSFYAFSPSGFQFECGYGGIEVDDRDWTPAEHGRISVWGHRPVGTMKNLHGVGAPR